MSKYDNVHINSKCELYKTCVHCEKTKLWKEFKHNRKNSYDDNVRSRKNKCLSCKYPLFNNKIEEYWNSFNGSRLTQEMILMTYTKDNYNWNKYIPIDEAKSLLNSQLVKVVDESTVIIYLLRHFIFIRDEDICYYCKRLGSTIDHLIPKENGYGKNDPENLVCCCSECNMKRQSMDIELFMAHRTNLR